MFSNIFRNKKVLITGNTGFKGSWLTAWLLHLEAKVYGLSIDIPTRPSIFELLNLREKIKFYMEDIRNLNSVERLLRRIKPDFIFHLAAQSLVSESYNNPMKTITTNVIGTATLLEALRVVDHACVAVIITSDKCYENVEWVWGYRENDRLGGNDIYSGSKSAAEIIFNSYFHSFVIKNGLKLRICTARAGNVIGGGDWAKDRIVPDCMRAWDLGRPVQIRNPNSTRPWQHVLEPLSGYLLLAYNLKKNKNLNGESFNFGPLSQNNHTVKELIENLSGYWEFKSKQDLYQVSKGRTFHEANLLKLNCDKALLRLGWIPTLDYEKVIEFTGSWYSSYYCQKTNMFDLTMSQITKYEEIAQKCKLIWTR